MTQQATEILIEGRVVNGHPMTRNNVTKKDEVTKVETPILKDGVQVTDSYLALAIPKAAETHWNQTVWGQKMAERAAQDWPNGEHGAPTFSWKITDGDSAIPNKAQKKPCEREGWAGHWIIHCSTRFFIKCYHVGKYDPTQQIQDEKEIKTGDYARVLVGAKGNGPSASPGIYLNPMMFELSRAGQAIINDSGPAAADVFGGAAPNVPANAAVAPAVAPVVPAITPATDFLNGPAAAPAPAAAPVAPAPVAAPVAPAKRMFGGVAYEESALLAAQHTQAMINTYPIAP